MEKPKIYKLTMGEKEILCTRSNPRTPRLYNFNMWYEKSSNNTKIRSPIVQSDSFRREIALLEATNRFLILPRRLELLKSIPNGVQICRCQLTECCKNPKTCPFCIGISSLPIPPTVVSLARGDKVALSAYAPNECETPEGNLEGSLEEWNETFSNDVVYTYFDVKTGKKVFTDEIDHEVTLCRYGKKCNREDCDFYHPIAYDKNNRKCLKCLKGEAVIVLSLCEHVVLCEGCVRECKVCPLCLTRVESYNRIF